MRQKIFAYSDEITSKELYDNLSQSEQKILNDFKDYVLIKASDGRADENVKEVLRFLKITGADLEDISIEDLRHYLKEVKGIDFADYTKNKMKTFIQRFLRWKFRADWEKRFDDFEDIEINNKATAIKPINSETVLNRKDIDALMKETKTLFHKTNLMVGWEGALRTGENRMLSWDRVKFMDDGFVVLTIHSKKGKDGSITTRELPLEDSAYYLKELRKQQRRDKIKSIYVFPSPHSPNKPISKAVNDWFSKLTKKVLGVSHINYALRHGRGTELARWVKEGKISKDNAVQFMGHSEKMFDKIYSHVKKEEVVDMMKEQFYNYDYMPEEKKHELEIKLEVQEKYIKELQEGFVKIINKMENKGKVE